jgi:hypothetical protein
MAYRLRESDKMRIGTVAQNQGGRMARLALFGLLIWLTAGCSANTRQPLRPKHIETPDFPPIARTAHLTGKITLTIAIDADGGVKTVDAPPDNPVEGARLLLQKYAIENIRH